MPRLRQIQYRAKRGKTIRKCCRGENKRLRKENQILKQRVQTLRRDGDIYEIRESIFTGQIEQLRLLLEQKKECTDNGPSFIIDAFCKILGITKEELLADSNFEWEEKLKRALLENRVVTK